MIRCLFWQIAVRGINCLKHNIICAWLNVKQFSQDVIIKTYYREFIEMLCLCEKGARHIYDHLMAKSNHKPICESKGHSIKI